jgi:hypothetical protein
MMDIGTIVERLDRIERLLIERKTIKDWYTTEDVADILDKSDYTVREWCRLGRVNAKKRESGRGQYSEWMIAHEELERIRNSGLLPLRKHAANGEA